MCFFPSVARRVFRVPNDHSTRPRDSTPLSCTSTNSFPAAPSLATNLTSTPKPTYLVIANNLFSPKKPIQHSNVPPFFEPPQTPNTETTTRSPYLLKTHNQGQGRVLPYTFLPISCFLLESRFTQTNQTNPYNRPTPPKNSSGGTHKTKTTRTWYHPTPNELPNQT